MAKPGRITTQLTKLIAWHTPIETLRELHNKLDPKLRKRFTRRLREIERLRAARGLIEPTIAPNDESSGESRSRCH